MSDLLIPKVQAVAAAHPAAFDINNLDAYAAAREPMIADLIATILEDEPGAKARLTLEVAEGGTIKWYAEVLRVDRLQYLPIWLADCVPVVKPMVAQQLID